MVLHSEPLIPNVTQFWYYIQNLWFRMYYRFRITLRISDSECNTKAVLHSAYRFGIAFRITDSECNAVLVLHSESMILNVIPFWYYIQHDRLWDRFGITSRITDSECNTALVSRRIRIRRHYRFIERYGVVEACRHICI